MNFSNAAIIYSSGQLGTDVVLTGNVKDGELVNADFSASAALAWSKISKTSSRISDLASHDINDTDTTLSIAKGGTGSVAIADKGLVVGNGGTAISTLAPGASGNVALSDGTNWTSAVPAGGSTVATRLFTSAEILALNSTPIEVIAAPGAGKIIVVESCVFSFTYNSIQYANGGTISLKGGTGNVAFITEIARSQDTNGAANVIRVSSADATDATFVANDNVVCKTSGALINGNSTWKLYVTYKIITL